MRTMLVAAACLTVSGCGMVMEQRITSRYQTFIGKSVAEAVISLGPPSTQFDTGPTTRAFQWTNTSSYRTPGVVNSIGNTMIVNPGADISTNCRVTFIAAADKRTDNLADWRIERLEWQASDMRSCQ